MGYAHKVNKVTIFGTSFGGAEEWSTGFFLGDAGADALPPTDLGAQFIRDQWETFFELTANQISYIWKTDGVKIATLNTDGTTVVDSVKTSYYGTAIQGGYGSIGNPPQIAVVASLLSGPGTGLGRKGRMFLPGVGSPMGADGHYVQTTATSLANTLGTFFNALNDSFDVGDRVVLASKGRTPPAVGAGITRPLELVKVGNTFDTQRRRRNQLSETYSSAVIDP